MAIATGVSAAVFHPRIALDLLKQNRLGLRHEAEHLQQEDHPEHESKRTQLTTWLASNELRDGRLQAVLSPSIIDSVPIHALCPPTRDLAPKVRVAVDALADAFLPVAPWDQGVISK
ncbi:hypothetical protein [Caballeronia sp. dw_19]|uniref:hypothetical protein n=1 Tax=Caballeronia sp. dw_19 TaxID=2719791 RepID=UPI001BD45AE4|nr:hypothetical protein [Caballeronia sp. dw_19]